MITRAGFILFCILFAAKFAAAAEPPRADKYFQITAVDRQTGRGVPLVELRTVNDVRQYTDSNGVVAFDEPGLMGQDVFFFVSSPGYEFPKDGFGYRGKTLHVVAGECVNCNSSGPTLPSGCIGSREPTFMPTACSSADTRRSPNRVSTPQVVGQDSALNAIFQGKLYWFWAIRAALVIRLAIFKRPAPRALARARRLGIPSAASIWNLYARRRFRPRHGPHARQGADLARRTRDAQRPIGQGADVRRLRQDSRPTRCLRTRAGRVQPLAANNSKRSPPSRPTPRFIPAVIRFTWRSTGRTTSTSQLPIRCSACGPMPIRSRISAAMRPTRASRKGHADQNQIDCTESGALHYFWKRNTAPVGPREQARLIAAGKLSAKRLS